MENKSEKKMILLTPGPSQFVSQCQIKCIFRVPIQTFMKTRFFLPPCKYLIFDLIEKKKNFEIICVQNLKGHPLKLNLPD